jgi:hypothetical protein
VLLTGTGASGCQQQVSAVADLAGVRPELLDEIVQDSLLP